jgi:hypothetical protein
VKRLVTAAVLATSATARADFANHELLRAHVDDVLAHVVVGHLDADQRAALYAPRLSLTAGLLVPGFGTYRLEQRMFGGIRPAGIVFDWILGGAAPIALGITALASDGRTRSICAWTALALYATTRAGILAIGSWHISAYNHEVDVHLAGSGLTATW